MTGFDEALEQSINALHAGASIDDCLAHHPQHADALAPLLGVAAALYAAPREDLSAAAFERQRQRMRVALQTRTATPTTNGHVATPLALPPARDDRGLRRLVSPRLALLAAVLLVAIILGLSGVTFASAQAAPDQPLYPVKRAVETLVLNLPADNETRARRALDAADARLADSAAVCLANPARADSLRAEMRAQREAALRWLDSATGAEADRLRAVAADLLPREAIVVAACVPRPVAPAAPAVAPLVATATPTATATATPTASPTASPTPTTAPTQVPTQRPTLPPTLTIAPAVVPAELPTETPTDAPPARHAAPAPSETPAPPPPPAIQAATERPPPPPPPTATQPPPSPSPRPTATQPPAPATATPLPPPRPTATVPPPPPPTATVRIIEVTKPPPATAMPRPNSVTATPKRP